MWNPFASLFETVEQYIGLILGFAALATVIAINQLVWRRRWHSYPTREQYLAAHPRCDTRHGITCSECGGRALVGPVLGAGHIYRCGWCDTELYGIDRRQTD